jgi:hypothetical protein
MTRKNEAEQGQQRKYRLGIYLRRPIDVRKLLSRLVNEYLKNTEEVDKETLKAVSYASTVLLPQLRAFSQIRVINWGIFASAI